jgi:predicted metal-dependent phosphoesterase TrpH
VSQDRVDLHIHSSKSSDGDFTPLHIVRLAQENGFRAISISDHDTVAAYPEALETGQKLGVELIPSVEMTTLYDGREFHLLLPFIYWASRKLRKILDRVTQARIEEAKERIARLQSLGFDISWEEVSRKSRRTPPLGVTIAQVLIDKGRKEKNPALEKYYQGENAIFAPYIFYRDYFMEDKLAFVPKRTVSLVDVLDVLSGDGAVPVLAHPGAYFEQATRADIEALKDRGLCGIEVFSSYHNPGQVRDYLALAGELDLVATAGSDFHGRIKPHIAFGSLKEGNYRMVEELKKRRM